MAFFDRKSGILLHITCLPSEFGIGDFGVEAYKFAGILKEAKQRYWQVLPLTLTSSSRGYSPYSPVSAFAGNTILIDPMLLWEKGLLGEKDIKEAKEMDDSHSSDNIIDFKRTCLKKSLLFGKAFQNFKSKKYHESDSFEEFCQNHGEKWLDRFSLFTVLKSIYKGKSWCDWPYELKHAFALDNIVFDFKIQENILKEKFLQFVFFSQWLELKKYCNVNGIGIIGDIPIYIDYESSDVWSNPDIFKLDKNKRPKYVGGVPPDYYSRTGQLWGNPVYDWEIMRKNDYDWWINRIKHNLVLFDFIRLDHFRGFIKYWQVNANDKTAENGHWEDADPEGFFEILKEKININGKNLPIIAEDLGYITPDVNEIMKENNFPGIRVALFGFGHDFPKSIHLPDNYDKNCVAYTGTHDNNTVLGYFTKEASPIEKKNIERYLAKKLNPNTITNDVIMKVSSSKADLTVFPIQDVLNLDSGARMNKPSTKRGNWRWRMGNNDLNINKFTFLIDTTIKNKRNKFEVY